MGDTSTPSTPSSSSSNKEPEHHALRIQTENLTRTGPSSPHITSNKSYNSINGSYTSSPIITPSGSSLLLPSSAITPLPSPLISNTAWPSNLAPDLLVLSPTPRRKGYGALGSGGAGYSDKRNATEFVLSHDSALSHDRSLSTGQPSTDGRLRREEFLTTRSRQSSVGDEAYVSFLQN
jgi:hypothetical protein